MHLKAKLTKTAKFLAVMLMAVIAVCMISTKSQAAQISGAGQVSITSGALNVRSSASAASGISANLSKDSYVTLLGKSGDWWQVRYSAGGYGYCSASYISVLGDDVATVNINYGVLNVRRGAGTQYEVKGSLEKGETVCVLWSVGNWTRILYDGSTIGWVHSLYISATPQGNTYISPENESSDAVVKLSVPYYYQRDSRWTALTLGTSGNTVGNQGCAITSLAMTESQRIGDAVTPANLLYSLKFTSGGALYLPSNYTSDYDGNYLAKAYDLLKSGKPVIIASKTSSGSQHWVVITGYTGDGISLKASDFTINDPGTSSRTELDAFFSAYPYFYKIVTYN